jgi:L-fucose mutarotase/ribose pyranase (RbsD/FucU family)
MQSQSDNELKYTDDDIRQLREAVIHILEINEELNANIVAMNAYVKNGDAKLRVAQKYIKQLEQALTRPQEPNWN